jgi:hypothetical protein
MKGDILAFSTTLNKGLIRCYNGRNYVFNIREWLAETPPLDNMPVRFEVKLSEASNVSPLHPLEYHPPYYRPNALHYGEGAWAE